MIKQINDNLYWIGVLDKNLAVFDVIMETKFGTSYNSYLIKTTHHNILVETVKNKFFDEYLANINELIGVDNIDIIIVNHTEPDHAGSLEKLLDLNPNIKVIGSKAAIGYLGDITNKKFYQYVVKPNEEMIIDNKTFKFIIAPFLHWPDSMYTYLMEDKALFTCDSFGAHFASEGLLLSNLKNDEEANYHYSLRYYYDAIFSPFKKFVLQAIDKIKGLDVLYICTGHGPVIDKNVSWYFNTYKTWSEETKSEGKLVVIPYASSYGYTEKMANFIMNGIKAVDYSINVNLYNLNITNYQDLENKITSEMYHADAILFGSTTINKDATPVIWNIVNKINPVTYIGKFTNVFGSYGWSGEGVDHIHQRLKCTGLKILPSIKLIFKPSLEDESALYEFGKSVANLIINNENNLQLINNNKITMKE
ncbi:MAG: flavoprotein [Haloplasmataceae bacterium]|jgi:flavorubredoxin|nr:flavoprotein [Haloplasmataceae bacterium]